MIRIVLMVLGLFSGCHAFAFAQWSLPAGVKTLEVNRYPMSFFEVGTGEPVVLVHGAISDYRSWSRQTASPPNGFRFFAISLRHHYPEPWDGKDETYSVKQHADDLTAFIEALGVGPVFLVGHSRGATVAVKTASARPALIKKLVLMEGPFDAFQPRSESGEIKSPARAVIGTVKQRFEKNDIDGGMQAWADRDSAGTWARLSEDGRQMRRDNAWTLIADGGDNPVSCAELASLRMPVLLMQGEKTPRRLAGIVDATHKCLPSAERATIPDAGHSMHVMNPVGFQQMLVQFLSK
jgi:pimeloyl-ACP methyl ester carboxylesterase